MTETAHETPALEMQLLTAQDGTAYLLPRALLEAARLTPEEAAAFRAEEGDDLQGLMFDASALQSRIDALSSDQQQSMLRLQTMSNKSGEMSMLMGSLVRNHADFRSSILQKMR